MTHAAIYAYTLLALLCLLALATSASAECGWVLWATRFDMPAQVSITEPVDAFKSKDECPQVQERRENMEDGRRKKDPSIERYFACLPDTVDPRGPKGE